MVITSKEVCASCTHEKKDCPNKYVIESNVVLADSVVIACQWYEKKE